MEFLVQLDIIVLIQVIFWFMAGIMSFYFSIGSARVWTSISTGFFLIFLSQAYPLNPYTVYHKLEAIHYIIGAVSIMLMTHGFQEYYVFSRTLETGGSKLSVYLATFIIILLTSLFVYINPKPTYHVLRNLRMIENSTWVFLALVNMDMIRKIYLQIRDSSIAKGFIAFGIVFFFIFLWKGSELYLQLYQWDKDWLEIIDFTGESTDSNLYPLRIDFFRQVHQITGLLSGLSVGATFGYLWKLLR